MLLNKFPEYTSAMALDLSIRYVNGAFTPRDNERENNFASIRILRKSILLLTLIRDKNQRKFSLSRLVSVNGPTPMFTAGIRTMGEGNIFSLCVSPHRRVPPSFLMGDTPSKSGRGTPSQDWMEVPPPPRGTEQQREDLLGGGRCASCVHAGGISCLL